MMDPILKRIEQQLQEVVERPTRPDTGGIDSHELIRQLQRAMEANLKFQPGQTQALAPDVYSIYLNETVYRQFDSHSQLETHLAQIIARLTLHQNYRLVLAPTVRIHAKNQRPRVTITCRHSSPELQSTARMRPVPAEQADSDIEAQLIINGDEIFLLSKTLVTLGRSHANDIILDNDPYISRQHLQIRLRDGYHHLFDADSRSGVMVNRIRVRHHVLQSGDVVQIGNSQLVYLLMVPAFEHDGDSTMTLFPVEED